jgi:hypothetical protein
MAQSPVLKAQEPVPSVQVPLYFVANKGQFDSHLRFVAHAPGSEGEGATFWFMPQGVRVALSRSVAAGQPLEQVREQLAFTVRFLGASAGSNIRGQNLLPGKANYFLGSDPARWRQNVPIYGEVRYQDLYPHTDLRYHGSGGDLKYDFVLRPGASVERIALGYEGIDGLRVNDAGQLEIETAWGTLIEEAPRAWQETATGQREPVAAAYRLHAADQLGFHLGAHDPNRPVVLDPTLNYSTYLGASNRDLAHYVVVDEQGNAIITGSTTSSDFPVTEGAYDEAGSDTWDVFVTKLAAGGGSLLFSTFVGGSGVEVGYGLALDETGNVLVAGATGSADFPTTAGAYDGTYGGGKYDAFVLKLAAGGDSLLYSTYVGGRDEDIAYALGLDGGEALVAGLTYSPSFPTTSNAYDGTHNGLSDAFVARLSNDGTSLQFSTLAGGSGDDFARRLAVTHQGEAVVTGTTSSENFPTTSGAYGPLHMGKQDAFALKLDASGRSLHYSTYLGGKGDDLGNGVALDRRGDAVVTGSTHSSNFPTTEGAYDRVHNGNDDTFVLKLTGEGTSLAWSTYLGGSNIDTGMVVELDSRGIPIVAGTTHSTNFPTSEGALDADHNGESDAFVAKLDASGESLLYSTYAGGKAQDEARGLAVTDYGDAVIAGWTESSDFPTTEDAYDPTFNLRQDGFVLRLDGLGSPPPLVADSKVGQSSDDAIERSIDGVVDLDGIELMLLGDPGTHTAGLRFPGIGVARGTKVLQAYVEFTATDSDSKTTNLTFHGQAVDNAPTFGSAANDITDRATTTAAVEWENVPPWSQAGAKYRSPDLSPIIQEILNRPGWGPGNALALILTGSGKREAVSYDGDPDLAPRLRIEYEGEAPTCYSLATTAEPTAGGTVTAEPTPNCGGSKYVAGTQVQLTAQPAEGYLFMGWSGAATGSANPATITMDGDKAVTARFRDQTLPLYLLFLPAARQNAQ